VAKRFDVSKAVRDATSASAGPPAGAEQPAAPKPAARTRRATKTPAGGSAAGAPATGRKATPKPAQTSRRTGAHLAAVPTTEEQLVDEQILHRGEPAKLARRVHVPLPENLFRYLKRANAEDDIDTTVRIRAMIELYEHDERHRTRVDKIAKKRNDELIRHRWN
jgi:hypothetical protein